MKLAIMQPYIFPYIGYFQLIHAVDTFVFYDDVNFIKKGWIHRNNILINNMPFLYTIPCNSISQNKLINEINLDFGFKQRSKFLKMIEMAYKKAPYFENVFSMLTLFFENDNNIKISDFAISSIKLICNYLDLKQNFKISSINFNESKGLEKQTRLINICEKEKASIYVNALGGKELYKKEDFENYEIQLLFLQTGTIKYKQYNEKFAPNLSIIDLLMFNDKATINKFLNSYKLI